MCEFALYGELSFNSARAVPGGMVLVSFEELGTPEGMGYDEIILAVS